MRYKKFIIENYRAIVKSLEIDVTKGIIPLVGVNECGKTTILQALFCFDSSNDKINEGRHLKNIMNLYETVDRGSCRITATVEAPKEKVQSIFNHFIRNSKEILKIKDSEIEEIEEEVSDYSESDVEYKELRATLTAITEAKKDVEDQIKYLETHFTNIEHAIGRKKAVELSITRELTPSNDDKNATGFYYCVNFGDDSETNEQLCEDIISECPFILYNDDFNDKPYDEIIVGEKTNNDWQNIYRRVFQSTDSVKQYSYDLDEVFDLNENRRGTILMQTSAYLSKILTKAWKELTLRKEAINVNLTMEKRERTLTSKEGHKTTVVDKVLKIKIKESDKSGLEYQFDLTDRSKGFIWYYNFIMKIQFNPKQSGNSNATVFLLDEPGSYLHESAQKELCQDLKKISEKEGTVIFCTHSPQLLNPQIIPPNKIKIVNKESGSIEAVNLTQYRTKGKKVAALQPVYEALGRPLYSSYENLMIICVEGIYDKYAIELFCTIAKNTRVFPSVNTDTIVSNIPYFITYRIPYVAIWDNDKAGQEDFKRAAKFFGSHESEKFTLLPNRNQKPAMRMEDMFDKSDFDMMSSEANLPIKDNYNKDDYQNLMNAIYFELPESVKTNMRKNLSKYAAYQFAQLSTDIRQKLEP